MSNAETGPIRRIRRHTPSVIKAALQAGRTHTVAGHLSLCVSLRGQLPKAPLASSRSSLFSRTENKQKNQYVNESHNRVEGGHSAFVPQKGALTCFGITDCEGFLGPEMSPAGCEGKPGIPDKNELEQRCEGILQ